MSGPERVRVPAAIRPAAATLWLVRHGHTVVQDTGGIAGRSDVPLSDAGRAAVAALGDSLRAALDARPEPVRWFASPLERTRASAALLRARLVAAGGRALALDERLVELDFGAWEGSTWEAVHREHGAALAAWGEDWVGRAPPHGETFAAQAARCDAWFDDVIDGAVDGAVDATRDRPRDAIVVTHGGSIRALACRLLGWPLASAMRLAVDPATVYRFERDARCASGWRLVGANLGDFG